MALRLEELLNDERRGSSWQQTLQSAVLGSKVDQCDQWLENARNLFGIE